MYHWRAVYNDGTFLDEYKEDGSPNKYYDIDRSKLDEFWLYNGDNPIYRLVLEPGQTLIYRFRRRMDLYTGEPKQQFFMIGWQQNVNGKNVQMITYIPENFDAPITSAGKYDGGEPELSKQELDSIGE